MIKKKYRIEPHITGGKMYFEIYKDNLLVEKWDDMTKAVLSLSQLEHLETRDILSYGVAGQFDRFTKALRSVQFTLLFLKILGAIHIGWALLLSPIYIIIIGYILVFAAIFFELRKSEKIPKKTEP